MSYFATKPKDELLSELNNKVDDYYKYLLYSRLLYIWRRSFIASNKALEHAGDVLQKGRQNEYRALYVNHYRNLLTYTLTLITNDNISWEVQATNSDFKSISESIVSGSILESFAYNKNLYEKIKLCAKSMLCFGEGFIETGWDANEGEDYVTDDDGKKYKEGDIYYNFYTPDCVIRDVNLFNFSDRRWLILKQYVNKYEFASKYAFGDEDLYEKIIATEPESVDYTRQITYGNYWNFRPNFSSETDIIPIYKFFHDPVENLINGGRLTIFTKDTIVMDGALPYRTIPIEKMASSDIEGLPFGYSHFWDILPLQKAIDTNYSTMITDAVAFGVPSILVQNGSGFNPVRSPEGLSILKYDRGFNPPSTVNFSNVSPNTYKLNDLMIRDSETLAGSSAALRGSPKYNINTASQMAMLENKSTEFNQFAASAYSYALKKVGECTLYIVKDFAKTKRISKIVGKDDNYALIEFSQKDIPDVLMVRASVGNPLGNTKAGKEAVADKLLNMGLVSSAKQYLTFVRSGRYEPLFRREETESMLIRKENEDLLDPSKPIPPVLITDDPMLHMDGHVAELSNPNIRLDAKVIERFLEHMQWHEKEFNKVVTNGQDTLISRVVLKGALPQQSEAPPQQNPIKE